MKMSNILCHIMGCNNVIKNKLINRHTNILFIDLDDASYKISNTPIIFLVEICSLLTYPPLSSIL